MPFPRFPEPPPAPVSAVFAPPETVTVEFDRLLQEGPIEPANWSLHLLGRVFNVNAAEALGNSVVLSATAGAIEPGEDAVGYSPPPFDVVSTQGVPAEGFSDFPVTA